MEHLQEEPSSVDNCSEADYSQPHYIHPSNGIQTYFKELCNPETPDSRESKTKILTSRLEEEMRLSTSSNLDTDSPVVTQLIDSDKPENVPELSYETVPVSPSVNNHVIQQLPESDIGEALEQLSKEVADQWSKYLLQIPQDSAKFIYHEQTISINVKQFNNHKKLGHGSFGSVYPVVISGPPDISMAVKRIPIRTDEDGFLSLYNELTTMQKVGCETSRYIVDYYCAMLDPVKGELCICMELMNTTVEKFYQAMHRLDEFASNNLDSFVRRVTHNITLALDFLEDRGIVHRDVKPANMLINTNAAIKLSDFGTSGNMNNAAMNYKVVVGTAQYLPPVPDLCTIQGDMWALGISLLEIVNGNQPFAGMEGLLLVIQILNWVPTVPPTISDEMQQIILHLLKKEAKERPCSYSDILNEPCIRNVIETPSNDECDFVRCIIKKIALTDNFNE